MGNSGMTYILSPSSPLDEVRLTGGGKAFNLARLTRGRFPVPDWICISAHALDHFLQHHDLMNSISISDQNFDDVEKNVEELFLSKQIPIVIREELIFQLERP